MRREHVVLATPALGGRGDLIAYGHLGRPLLAFPSQEGKAWDFEDRGMIEALAPLIDAGQLKVYCVDSLDSASWHRQDVPLEERARLHGGYEDWILGEVVPWIHADCSGLIEIMATGCSFGAYHAANFALKHAHVFPLALCMSGVYDVAALGWGPRHDAFYFNNPMSYVPNLTGDHLEWLRRHVNLVLVAGQGQWEDTTGALDSTRRFAKMLERRGIKHEMDLWGFDVPHDWPSWAAQIAHHVARFC